jgi:hypothetical protein
MFTLLLINNNILYINVRQIKCIWSRWWYFRMNPTTGVTRHIDGDLNGQCRHSTLNLMLQKQRAHQIIQKYARKRKNQMYNPYIPSGRKFILTHAGFTNNEIKNYETKLKQ